MKNNSEKRGSVVHCKKEKYDVYIGRPSRWGNPFTMKEEADRERVIGQYREWLQTEIRNGKITRDELLQLRGKKLGCWCAPRACHGDVLLQEAEKIYKEEMSP